jgi:hypothetical protein
MIRWPKQSAATVICLALLAGCRAGGNGTTPPQQEYARIVDLDPAIANAHGHPIVLLIGEFGPAGKDCSSRGLLTDPAVQDLKDGCDLLTIDLGISRNRAAAARFHTVQTPVLVCLSSKGIVVSRDVGNIDGNLLIKALAGLSSRAADLDAKFDALQNAVASNNTDPTARLALANFLLNQGNDREAIPFFKAVADADAVETGMRVEAWVAMARCHLWIAEPEKARHDAKALIAILGPNSNEAIAGGNFVLGLQDATAKRFTLARQEFEHAVSAAPESVYARQAAASLSQLPSGKK